MKFLQSEYEDIKKRIEASPIPYEEFSFVKRKGNLNVIRGESRFIFHRKTVTEIADGNFVSKTIYLLDGARKKNPLDSWDEVMTAFDMWISGLDP